MELLDTEDLALKQGRTASPINAAIRKALSDIPEGKSVLLKDLVAEAAADSGASKAKVQVRVGTILKAKKFLHLFRTTNADGKTCIGW